MKRLACAAVVGLCARSTSLEGPLGTRSLSIGLTSISGHVVAGGHCSPLMSAAVSSSMLSASSASNAVHSSHGARGAGVGGAHPHHGGGCCYRVGDVIGLLIRWLSSREVPNILWIEDDEGEEEGGAESSSSSDSASSGSGGQPRARPYDGVQVTFSINGRVVAMSGPLLVPHGTDADYSGGRSAVWRRERKQQDEFEHAGVSRALVFVRGRRLLERDARLGGVFARWKRRARPRSALGVCTLRSTRLVISSWLRVFTCARICIEV